jgi:hypothetical protein
MCKTLMQNTQACCQDLMLHGGIGTDGGPGGAAEEGSGKTHCGRKYDHRGFKPTLISTRSKRQK